jgi:nitrous oxide reductase accessory protein NosL
MKNEAAVKTIKEAQMKQGPKIGGIMVGLLVFLSLCASAHADMAGCRTCDGVTPGSPYEVRIEYRDGTARSTCGLRCTGALLAAYRGKNVQTIQVREHGTGKLVDAKKAFWVLGLSGGRTEAFSGRPDAASFLAVNGGRVANFGEMMSAIFAAMYDGVQKSRLSAGEEIRDDITRHPECTYCGMDRKMYAHSRVVLRYRDRTETGLCSVHCAGLDLALHPGKVLELVMVGAYDTGKLLDAEKAVWVLGGSKYGVMSIRGKWAFETREAAGAFIRESGGGIATFRDVMTAAFEDMWEIIR